jgi:protease-4
MRASSGVGLFRSMRSAALLTMRFACRSGWPGCTFVLPFGTGNNRGKLVAETLEPAHGWFASDQILMIPLSGMVDSGSLTARGGEPGMLVGLKDRLLAARENRNLRAIVLRIDSPGGTVTAADLIHREITQFKQETKLPVIALMNDMAASGGVYIAMAADEVYALPTTLTGSIGVIAMFPNISELSQKIGLEMNAIKSGRNKDAGSVFRKMSPEQQEIFQTMVNTYYERFLKIVLEGRPKMQEATLREVADGRILTPDQALAAGLIDGVMYPDEVYKRARALAGLQDAAVISYEYPYAYRGHVLAEAGDAAPRADAAGNVNLINFDLGRIAEKLSGPQFMYLWTP